MLAINGYYNGTNIVLDDNVEMKEGQRLLIVMDSPKKGKRKIDLNKYIEKTDRGRNVDAYMEEMRAGDRI